MPFAAVANLRAALPDALDRDAADLVKAITTTGSLGEKDAKRLIDLLTSLVATVSVAKTTPAADIP
jgi:hypothetical protein